MIDIANKKTKQVIALVMVGFIVVLMAIVIGMNVFSTMSQQQILEDSIKSQLLSITVSARGMVDADTIDSYNSIADVEADIFNFVRIRQKLRTLAADTGADFIYVLKVIDGEVMFIMDTDEEDESIFIPYEIDPVHEEAFAGHESAGVMNVVDEYGSYNTAALPIFKGDQVIAIICTDIEDQYLQNSTQKAWRNTALLTGLMLVALTAMGLMVIFLLSRVARMQKVLSDMAHRDTVTGLPNRQYLLEFLQNKTKDGKDSPFALLFIDLDNFKKVNDSAGHDAGDELLRSIATFLEATPEDAKSFRPSPGTLNIAARIGGDEFVQVVDGIENEEQAARVAQNLLDSFSMGLFSHYEEKYNLGLSIGIALYPKHTSNFHVLIKYADVAMYFAKHGGKNDYRVYKEEMGGKAEGVEPGEEQG